MNDKKRQKDMKLEDEPPNQEGVQYATGEEQRQLLIAPQRMKWLSQSRSDAQQQMCLVVKEKSEAVKENIAYEPGMLSS